ncbi:MAG TPA: SDR family oxidoreductase [Nocardioidaceae bacterium]|nr:SDR family oxidoreductase [Nocardioidaceae bacterium]
MPVALVTGASRGLGRALSLALAGRGWQLVIDARGEAALDGVARELESAGAKTVTAIAGDVSDRAHRADLAAAVVDIGRLDLLVNNASVLGPSPQPALADYPLDVLVDVYDVNVFAPLGLLQLCLGRLRESSGIVVDVTSDASVEPYEGWGGYGSSKAALDQATAILGAEEPSLSVYAFDPGDMRTELHQQAFPDDDISDRPEPSTVVPALLRLIDDRPVSGRYRASDLALTGGER